MGFGGLILHNGGFDRQTPNFAQTLSFVGGSECLGKGLQLQLSGSSNDKFLALLVHATQVHENPLIDLESFSAMAATGFHCFPN